MTPVPNNLDRFEAVVQFNVKFSNVLYVKIEKIECWKWAHNAECFYAECRYTECRGAVMLLMLADFAISKILMPWA